MPSVELPWRRLGLAWLLAFASVGLAQPAAPPAQAPATGHGEVWVMYAGSLANVMEHDLGPAFDRATGFAFRGEAKGSKALANEIKGELRRGDVFISASASVDASLMGPDNGNWVRWYVTFAEAPVVIGYNPRSRFARAFESGSWLQALSQPGLRLGRTDPRLDPKGVRAIELLQNAQEADHREGLVHRVLGAPDNPRQIFPEQDLVGRLQSGQLDAAFFYSNEAAALGIPFVTPPAAIDPKATFTVTILSGAPHRDAAVSFVAFLLGPAGRHILERSGLTLTAPGVHGDGAGLPAALRGDVSQP